MIPSPPRRRADQATEYSQPAGPWSPLRTPRDIADLLGPTLVPEINGFLVRRGRPRISGSDAEKFNYFLLGAIMDGLTKPRRAPVMDVVGKVVKTPRRGRRS